MCKVIFTSLKVIHCQKIQMLSKFSHNAQTPGASAPLPFTKAHGLSNYYCSSLAVCLPDSASYCLYVRLSDCLSVYRSVCPSVCPPIRLSVFIPNRLWAHSTWSILVRVLLLIHDWWSPLPTPINLLWPGISSRTCVVPQLDWQNPKAHVCVQQRLVLS